MKRLKADADASLACVRNESCDALGDHLAGFFKTDTGTASDYHDQGICVERSGFIRGAEVVFNILLPLLLRGRWEHSAAAHAGYVHACVLHVTHT